MALVKKSLFDNLNFFFGILIAISLTTMAVQQVTADIEDNEVKDVYMYMGVQVYEIERECAMVGGLCVQKNDCSQPTSRTGLCPKNQHRGVECCYELPIRETACAQHLGMCMPRCNRLLQRPANDCSDGEVCCVLI